MEIQFDARAAVNNVGVSTVPGDCTPNKNPIVMLIGETFAMTTPNAQVVGTLTIPRAPAGNALTVSGLGLSGPFAVVGRYALLLTIGPMVRQFDVHVAPAALGTTPNLGAKCDPRTVYQAYLRDPAVTVSDAVADGLSPGQPYPIALGPLARGYGGGN